MNKPLIIHVSYSCCKLTVSLASVIVDTVLGLATVELGAVREEGVYVERLVDEPLASRRELPSVPSP